MKLLKSAIRFLALVTGIYILVILSLNKTELDTAYRNLYIATHSALIDGMYGERTLQFEKHNGAANEFDLEVRMVNDKDIERAKKQARKKKKKRVNIRNATIKYSLYSRGFLGVLMLILLFSATWLSWKSKWIYLLAAILIFDILVTIDLCMTISSGMQKHDFLRLYERGSIGDSLIKGYSKYFPGFSDITVLIATFIWLIWLFLISPQIKLVSGVLNQRA